MLDHVEVPYWFQDSFGQTCSVIVSVFTADGFSRIFFGSILSTGPVGIFPAGGKRFR